MAFCLMGISNSFGQAISETTNKNANGDGGTALEEAMKIMNVNFNLSQFYTASTNKSLIYPAEGANPTIPQLYENELSSGNTEINVIFDNVHSILTHKDGECKILIYAAESLVRFGRIIQANNNYFKVLSSTFNRIKREFRYGDPKTSATREEIEELDMMVRHCPKEQALKLFNAEEMLMYPMNLRGNAFEDKYTRSRAVVVAKNGLSIFFYFMMTDESVKNFDQYLKDLSGSFMFN